MQSLGSRTRLSLRDLEPGAERNQTAVQEPSSAEHTTHLTPLALCGAAINDPLRPMLIDLFVFDGKHLGEPLNSIKSNLENDYGTFLTVHDDATVEKVDEKTGKIGCAVTYNVNLQGLAEKVLKRARPLKHKS